MVMNVLRDSDVNICLSLACGIVFPLVCCVSLVYQESGCYWLVCCTDPVVANVCTGCHTRSASRYPRIFTFSSGFPIKRNVRPYLCMSVLGKNF